MMIPAPIRSKHAACCVKDAASKLNSAALKFLRLSLVFSKLFKKADFVLSAAFEKIDVNDRNPPVIDEDTTLLPFFIDHYVY